MKIQVLGENELIYKHLLWTQTNKGKIKPNVNFKHMLAKQTQRDRRREREKIILLSFLV